jgi:transposase
VLLVWFSRDSAGELMRRFVEEADRGQWTLLPECLDDFIDESNPVRVIDVFVDALDLAEMSFEGGGAGGDWSAIVPPLGSP